MVFWNCKLPEIHVKHICRPVYGRTSVHYVLDVIQYQLTQQMTFIPTPALHTERTSRGRKGGQQWYIAFNSRFHELEAICWTVLVMFLLGVFRFEGCLFTRSPNVSESLVLDASLFAFRNKKNIRRHKRCSLGKERQDHTRKNLIKRTSINLFRNLKGVKCTSVQQCSQ